MDPSLIGFDNKVLIAKDSKAPKKKLFQISINTGPTPNFLQNKMSNIATSYKETSEKIKYEKDKFCKNNFDKRTANGLLIQKHTMRHADDFIGNKLNNEGGKGLNVMKRNLTNFNRDQTGNYMSNNSNLTNSIAPNYKSNYINNSSMNSSYFPKNNLVNSGLNDSNSLSKGQLTFTNRNYNDSQSTINNNHVNYNTNHSVSVNYFTNGNVKVNGNESTSNKDHNSNKNIFQSKPIANGITYSNKLLTNNLSKQNANSSINTNNTINTARNSSINNATIGISNLNSNSNNSVNKINTKYSSTMTKKLQLLNFKTFKNGGNMINSVPVLSPTSALVKNVNTTNPNETLKENGLMADFEVTTETNPNNNNNNNNTNTANNEADILVIQNQARRLAKIRSGSHLNINSFNNLLSNRIRKESLNMNNISRRNNSLTGNKQLTSVKSVDNINRIISTKSNAQPDAIKNSNNGKLHNNKSLSIIGVKERYKELLKNKSIPASLMIKNFKLSTDMGSNRVATKEQENPEEIKKPIVNANFNSKINNPIIKNVKVIKKQLTSNYPLPPQKQNLLPNCKNNKDFPNLKSLIEDNCNKSKEFNNANANNRNKILSMDLLNSLNSFNNHIIVHNNNININENINQKLSPMEEETPQTIKKASEEQNKAPEENDFDDINSIIKNINFANINVNKENIFSRVNFLYNNFDEKFNEVFENKMMTDFMERSSCLSWNLNKRYQNSSHNKDKSLSTQDTSSKKSISPLFKKKGIMCEPFEKVNLFNVHLSKME